MVGNFSVVGNELDALTVHGDSPVGWCAHTPPNETVDDDGNVVTEERGFGVADPRSPRQRVYDDPEVCALRDRLQRTNGIRGLDICAPDEIERAARIFARDGFVVVRDLLDADTLARFREGSTRALREILSTPGKGGRKYITESSRLPHRYSYGTASSSRQMLHDPVWASMVDLDTTTPILTRLFGGPDYYVIGAGGDLCLPGAIEYQHLHADVRETSQIPVTRAEQAVRMGARLQRDDDGRFDLRTERRIVELTPPIITINFAMSDLTPLNGPIRQIPGTHVTTLPPPTPAEEPEWMRLSTLVGTPAGSGIFRDNRAWHGATPNVSRAVRALPNVEYAAPWTRDRTFAKSMPYEIWETLSPHGKAICRRITEAPGVWPAGAGMMHPLRNERQAAKARGGQSST